jgi:cell division protein DivIC
MSMSILNHFPSWLKNKYFLATAFFLSWMLFFDHNDLFTQAARSSELSELQESRRYYREQINKTRTDVENVRINPLSLEKIAREKYMMKKDNEEVFIIEQKP